MNETMRAVLIDEPGGPEHLRIGEAPRPRPARGSVLIRVEAAGINRPDVMQRAGHYPPPHDASSILGLEVAGEIAYVGEDAARWRVGDPVCALVNGGGYAEYCTAPAGQCLPVPRGLDAAQAASLPETCFTVWANLFAPADRAGAALASGETVLIHGGSSGIGVTAIQLAKARGARVIVTAGSLEKCDACVRLGADAAINYREADFAEGVRAFTAGRGVDVVLDMVGAPYLARNLDCLAKGGRLSMIATQGGSKAEIDLRAVIGKRLRVMGSTMRPRSAEEKAEIGADLEREVWPSVEAGLIRPVLDSSFPLEGVADAHRLMEAGGHVGKIVLTLA